MRYSCAPYHHHHFDLAFWLIRHLFQLGFPAFPLLLLHNYGCFTRRQETIQRKQPVIQCIGRSILTSLRSCFVSTLLFNTILFIFSDRALYLEVQTVNGFTTALLALLVRGQETTATGMVSATMLTKHDQIQALNQARSLQCQTSITRLHLRI